MNQGEYLLSEAKVGSAVARLALPSILATLISMIYNLTDTYFIGMLNDTDMLAATSMAMPVMWLASALCGILAAGAPQLISLKLGAGEREAANRLRAFCVMGTLGMSLLLTPAACLLARPELRLMGAEGAVLTHAAAYLDIILGTSAISATGGALQGVLRANGRTAQASIASAVGIGVNIVLDPVFILGLGMEMRGAALATALGGAASLIAGACFLRGEIAPRAWNPGGKLARRVLKLSLASTCSSLITVLTLACSFALAADYGGGIIASLSVGSKLYSVVMSLASALAFSLQPFIGYNFGAKNFSRLRRGLAVSLSAGSTVCAVGTVLFLTMGKTCMGIFTRDTEVIEAGAKILRALAVGTPTAALQMTAISYLSGTGKVVSSLIAGLARQLILFVPALLILRALFGLDGMILSYPVSDILSTILAVGLCVPDGRRYLRKGAAR